MSANPMSLEGRKILITGASSGIGEACARLMDSLGASTVLVGRNQERLSRLVSELSGGGSHKTISMDISQTDAIVSVMDSAIDGGKLDGLVHAAGIGPMMPVGLLTSEHIKSVFDINYFAFLELMRLASKIKYRNQGFAAVAVSSISAFAGWPGIVAYSGSKGAVSASVRSLAMELAPKGIRVNAICPSNVKTPMYDKVVGDMNTEESEKKILAKQPLGLGLPEDVANAAAFLISDAARFITGVNLPVDGGYLAQ